MAFLAPALRWPDALGIDATAMFASIRPHMPSPLNQVSDELLFSLCVSFSVIVVLTLLTTALQARHPRASASAVHASHTPSSKRVKHGDVPVVLLAGPSGAGKTSLFSALAFHSVPSVHPSQRASESKTLLIAPESKNEIVPLNDRSVLLVDTPGHPRIKDGILDEYIARTDCIVFCIDAKEALRGNAGIGLPKEGSLTEAVDQLHELLIRLAKTRLSRKAKSTPPPSVLVLLTRADLSPHTANISLSSLSADESKRRNFLLARARTAIEVELGRRRAGMGFGSRRTTKVGGMTKVTGGQSQASVWTSIMRIIGFSSRDASAGAQGAGAYEDEDDEEIVDYVDWDVLERSLGNTSVNGNKNGLGVSAGTSLEKLDVDIVQNGKADFAFASVGKERGWDERAVQGLDELRRILISA